MDEHDGRVVAANLRMQVVKLGSDGYPMKDTGDLAGVLGTLSIVR